MSQPARKYRQTARAEAVRENRRRVLEAARIQFFSKPFEEVTLRAIAEAAGLTVQTVLRQFGSKESLLEATIESIHEQVNESTQEARVGDAMSALDGVLRRYESFGDGILRILTQEDSVEPFGLLAKQGRENHRAWIEEVFGPMLPPAGTKRERRILQILLLLDVYSWKLLRQDHGAEPELVRAALAELLDLLLSTKAAESDEMP